MSETATERETEVVVGTIKAIVIKGGDKWTVTVEPDGSKFSKNLWTKSAALVEEAQQLIGERQAFQCGISNYTDSKTGEPRHSLWINGMTGAEAGVQSSAKSAKPSTAGGTEPDVDWDAKDRRDFRSRAWAQTIAAFTHTIKTDEKPEAVFLRLQPFQRKVYEDVCGLFAYPEDGSDTPFSGAGQSPLSEHDQNIEF